ncbi:unnamed protein product [Moneuplotes crassus]|uniref:Uncharacterized protein n=1 Tax=Euplotes crassus TaxID=5936 RepID=A0AAD1X5C1_EUPCR|nr:unnamed protein product [Moneuplotes crassus]
MEFKKGLFSKIQNKDEDLQNYIIEMGKKHITKFMEDEKKKDEDNPLSQDLENIDDESVSDHNTSPGKTLKRQDTHISLIGISKLFNKSMNLKDYLNLNLDFMKGNFPKYSALDFKLLNNQKFPETQKNSMTSIDPSGMATAKVPKGSLKETERLKKYFSNSKSKESYVRRKKKQAIDYYMKVSSIADPKLQTQVANSSHFKKIYTGRSRDIPEWSLKHFKDIDAIVLRFNYLGPTFCSQEKINVLDKKSTLKKKLRFSMGNARFSESQTSRVKYNPLLEKLGIISLQSNPGLLNSIDKRMETWDDRINLNQKNSPRDQANRLLQFEPLNLKYPSHGMQNWDVSVSLKGSNSKKNSVERNLIIN